MAREIILPQPIDVHVHLREPGATQKEDFESGTRAAVAGGYATVLDMPNNPPLGTATIGLLEEKRRLAEGKIYADVGFHFLGRPETTRYFPEIIPLVHGLKLYMNDTTGSLYVDKKKDLETVFKAWRSPKPIIVHSEGETAHTAITLARRFKKPLHIAHVSQKSEIEAIKEAKNSGMNITCEVSAHHLFLTERDAVDRFMKPNPFGMMRPPLAREEDRIALWDNIKVIDMIASDHAPHTIEEKTADPEKIPNGIPGLETTLPMLMYAVYKDKLSIEDIIRLTHTGPRDRFGVQVFDDTYSVVDIDAWHQIDAKSLQTRAGWTPFDGMFVNATVTKTVIRGETVYENGEVVGAPHGRVVTSVK